MVVIEAVRQAFQMAEHIRAHLRLHPDPHDMTVELDEVIQQHPDDIQEQQSRSAENDCAVTLFRDQIIEHEARDDGIQDSHQGYGKGGEHIQYKQPPMRAIVGNETFQHGTAPCGAPLNTHRTANRRTVQRQPCFFVRLLYHICGGLSTDVKASSAQCRTAIQTA